MTWTALRPPGPPPTPAAGLTTGSPLSTGAVCPWQFAEQQESSLETSIFGDDGVLDVDTLDQAAPDRLPGALRRDDAILQPNKEW